MKAVIALGANIGEPKENLDLAIALLREATDVHWYLAITQLRQLVDQSNPIT